MITRNTTLKLIKEKYPYLTSEFDVEKIGIFGSVAKESEQEGSDIDLVVEFKRSLGLKFIELIEYLETIFGKKVDILTPAGIDNIRIKKVAEDIKRNIIYV